MGYHTAMQQRLVEQIHTIATKLSDQHVAAEFINRAKEGRLTRDENPYTHFCVYFAAYDPDNKSVFVGHHKKSGLWLFNGGHIDRGETTEEALSREMGEEWGVNVDLQSIGEPKLITITEIDNPAKETCTRHYDIWYFVPVSNNDFAPDQERLNTEFYTTGWRSIEQARGLITDASTLKALAEFEQSFA